MNDVAPGSLPRSIIAVRHHGAGAATLAVALVGGVAARLGGLPLPWLLGSLFLTALVGLLGAPIQPIRYGRTIGQVVIGAAIGVQFTTAVIFTLISLIHLMVAVA